ncbi:MAG: hypothetical protein AB8G99_25320, partial [Planctomycetaceae bacterium]
VQNARGCQELVRRIATRFTALKELTIDAQHAQAEVLDELRSLKLQRIVLLDPTLDVMRRLNELDSVTSVHLKMFADEPSEFELSKLPPAVNNIYLRGKKARLTAKHFETLSKYKNLVELNFSNIPFDADDVAKFEAALPNCRVLYEK